LRLHSRYGPPDCSAAQRRPLSRGSNPCSCLHKPLVSYLRVESSYTDDSRLRGALPIPDLSRRSKRSYSITRWQWQAASAERRDRVRPGGLEIASDLRLQL